MAKKRITKPIVVEILKHMCKIAGYTYGKINWKDKSHRELVWTYENAKIFHVWLQEYIYNMTLNNIVEFTRHPVPKTLYRNKKKAKQLSTEFINNFGFKIKQDDKTSKNN